MAEEKKEQWLNFLALTTVILAVTATLSTFYGQRNSTRAVLSEIKASNQWGYYQAKKIRGYLFELQKENMEIDLKLRGPEAPAQVTGELQKLITDRGTKIAKWDADRDQIESLARDFEKTRDDALNHGQAFGLAVIFLQLAILLSSIAALMKKKAVWIVGLVIGVAGLVYFANGFLLFM